MYLNSDCSTVLCWCANAQRKHCAFGVQTLRACTVGVKSYLNNSLKLYIPGPFIYIYIYIKRVGVHSTAHRKRGEHGQD